MDGMDGPITQLVWVTRETITARHVEGLAGLLDEVGPLSHAQVRIVVMPHGGRAILPPGSWSTQTAPCRPRLPSSPTMSCRLRAFL